MLPAHKKFVTYIAHSDTYTDTHTSYDTHPSSLLRGREQERRYFTFGTIVEWPVSAAIAQSRRLSCHCVSPQAT